MPAATNHRYRVHSLTWDELRYILDLDVASTPSVTQFSQHDRCGLFLTAFYEGAPVNKRNFPPSRALFQMPPVYDVAIPTVQAT